MVFKSKLKQLQNIFTDEPMLVEWHPSRIPLARGFDAHRYYELRCFTVAVKGLK